MTIVSMCISNFDEAEMNPVGGWPVMIGSIFTWKKPLRALHTRLTWQAIYTLNLMS